MLMHWHNSIRNKVYFNYILMYMDKELNKHKLICSDVNSLIQEFIVHEEEKWRLMKLTRNMPFRFKKMGKRAKF
jgi:glycyl-tRNA synthetase alpha subunit